MSSYRINDSASDDDSAPWGKIMGAVGLVVVAIVALIFMLDRTVTVPVGSVGVLGSWGSVDTSQQPLSSGFHLVGPGTDVYNVSVQPQRFNFSEVKSAGSDGQEIDVDVSVNFRVTNAATVYVNGGPDHNADYILKTILDPNVQSIVKQAIPRYSIVPGTVDQGGNLVANPSYIVNHRPEIQSALDRTLGDIVSKYGLLIDGNGINITNIHGDAKFQAAVEETAIAQQGLAKAKADAAAKVAAAQGDAQANAARQSTLTPEQLQWAMIQKWNGVLPQAMGSGNPFVQLTK